MIAVAQSRQLERFCRQVGAHSKKQAIKCESCACAKAQNAKCSFPANRSRQVVHRVRQVSLLAFAESPVHISENGRCWRASVMRSNTHQHAAGSRKVILCRKDGGLEYPQCTRIADEVRPTAI